ncbi:unnamed protein product [Nezara viridula]|uniref:Uncharacterized protein n=1 Tax=Nezara viridula TaxID=85310 RepID=A0A9P0EA27_NEZVI|nr:unnamed protein product [Nezara viridula]
MEEPLNTNNMEEASIRTSFIREHLKFQGIPLEYRPVIPKVTYSKSTLQTVLAVDILLQEYITTDSDIDEIRHWIYIAARTVVKQLGLIREVDPPKGKNISDVKRILVHLGGEG